jgi:hypothetical protein
MKLNQPTITDRTFTRTLPDELSYLAPEGEAACITITCRPGGYVNPKYLALIDQADLARQADQLGLAEKMKDRSEYAAASDANKRKYGEHRFSAVYDACVVDWATNIQDGGRPMVCDKERFMALAATRIPAISDAFLDFARFVEDVAAFYVEADKATEKN